MLTEYDIQRLSAAIVENLITNDKFIQKMAKHMPKEKKLCGSTKAASILGISRKTVCQIAEYLGGIKGEGESAHWLFPEDELISNYIHYKNR